MKISPNFVGFSLTEVLIAMSMMSIVALSLANIVPESYFTSYKTNDVAKASELAEKYIEEVKYDLQDLSIYNSIEEGSTPPIDITDDYTDNGNYNVSVDVLHVGTTGREDYLKEITVTYSKASTQNELIDLSTVIIKPNYSI